MTKHRRNAILARWRDIIAYGALAGIIWYVFAPLIESLSTPVLDLTASIPLCPMLAFWASLGSVLLWLLGRGRWMGLLGLRHLFSFPPLWLGILISALTAVYINSLWPRDPFLKSFTFDLVASCLVATGIVLLTFRAINRGRSQHVGIEPSDSIAGLHLSSDWKEQLQSFEGLKKWILTDNEVAHPRQNLFDVHDSIAQRISQRLADSSVEVVPTIAVIGELGSGKSTIGRLVEHYLRSSSPMLFVKLSLWPFDSTDAAVRGILNEVVRALGTRVNTLSLTGLPEQYAATVEKLGRWASVVALFRPSPNPKEVIERVDRIALATGLRIVLWIEDLERFSVSAIMEGESAALREEERLGPIRSLLWLLNECKHIGVVVADTSLRTRFDVDKIARFIERVPSLELDSAGSVIQLFRRQCLSGFPRTVIDPVHPKVRDEFSPSEPLVHLMRSYLSSDRDPEPFDALIDVVRTPRALKNALRWTLETWERMPGEIDLDHVIAASALRSSNPAIFEFIDTNISWFRQGPHTATSQQNDPMQHKVYVAFDELLKRAPSQATLPAIRSLVRFIFAAFPRPHAIADVDRQYLERPQGLNIRHDWIGAEPVDYWNRYLRCAPIPDDRSDQRVLRQIDAWKQDKANDLVCYLIDKKRNHQVEAFLSQFQFSHLLSLLTEVANRERGEGTSNWSVFLTPPGTVSVWRMLNRCGVRGSPKLTSKLEELLQGVVPFHLPFAAFLLQYFCVPSEGSSVSPLTDVEGTKRLSELTRGRLLEAFTPVNAEALGTAMQGANPYLFRNFLQDIKRGCGFQGELPIEGWKPLSDTLLELAELDPPTGVPLVLTFVTLTNDRVVDSWDGETDERLRFTRVVEYQLQTESAMKFFDWNRLHRLLAEKPIPNDISGWIREMWSTARQAASR